MKEELPAGWSEGRLIGVGAPGEVVRLDCSGGEDDIPDDQWCDGELVGVGAPGEVVTLDCPQWEQGPEAPTSEPAGGLRVVTEGNPNSPAEKPVG
jgi:hypothetical protein